jgi:hypothetical protein
MAGTANTYGQINPQIVDPAPIETTLAGMAADPLKQGIGLPLLALYRSDRGLQGAYAADEMQKQHQFMRDRLQAEIAKNIADATTAAAKEPGALELLNATQGGYGGQINQDVMARAIQRQNMQANAAQMKTTLEGAKAGAEGGYFMPTADVSGLIGSNVERGDPTTTTNAKIAAAARIAAAQAGAGGGSAVTIPGNMPGGGQFSQRFRNVTPENAAAVAAQAAATGKAIGAGFAPQVNLTPGGQQPAPAAGTPAAGIPTPNVGGGASPSAPRTDQRDVAEGARMAGSAYVNSLPTGDPIKQKMQQGTGRPPIQAANGTYYVLTPSGDGYPIPKKFLDQYRVR